jgi:hypothetical protein
MLFPMLKILLYCIIYTVLLLLLFILNLKIYYCLLVINTMRTGDENSRHWRFLLYNCERQMTQICLLTHAWILRT